MDSSDPTQTPRPPRTSELYGSQISRSYVAGGDKRRGRPSKHPRRRAVRTAALLAFVLHGLAASWIWITWDVGLRSGLLVWMDFPSSLLYLHAQGWHLLALSLFLGGFQYALIGAGLSALLASLLLAGRRR